MNNKRFKSLDKIGIHIDICKPMGPTKLDKHTLIIKFGRFSSLLLIRFLFLLLSSTQYPVYMISIMHCLHFQLS
jgi:hypothetical protein